MGSSITCNGSTHATAALCSASLIASCHPSPSISARDTPLAALAAPLGAIVGSGGGGGFETELRAESCAEEKRIDLVWRCPERGTV